LFSPLDGDTKFGAFLPARSFQPLQIVGEGIECNAEKEIELLRRALLAERRGLFG
jgi:hypothetical protein